MFVLGGYANNLNILIMDDGSNVTIESNTTINGAEFWITEGMNITIGEDCMFAKNIELRTGDNHAIFQGNKRLNKGGSISIGNHVWIGANAKIMKGVVIPSGISHWQCFISNQAPRRRKCDICRNSDEVD